MSVILRNGHDRTVVLMKIGGSILLGANSYARVAAYLKRRTEMAPREKLVVVVSAQKFATSVLERRARHIVRAPKPRTLDLLWSTGELQSVAVLALHLEACQVSAVGLNVHETGLRFPPLSPSSAPSPALESRHLDRAIANHAVVIVPGFLAARWDHAVVTLGRGGSDLSAVLLAIGLRAARCELLKDVPGYFAEDPRKNTRSPHLPSLTFREALRMAERGCELVQTRALEAAAEADLPLVIRSLDDRAPSSVISSARSSSTMRERETAAADA